MVRLLEAHHASCKPSASPRYDGGITVAGRQWHSRFPCPSPPMSILLLLFCIFFPFGFARVTFSWATLLFLLVLGKSTRPSFPQYTAVRLHFASVLFLPSRAVYLQYHHDYSSLFPHGSPSFRPASSSPGCHLFKSSCHVGPSLRIKWRIAAIPASCWIVRGPHQRRHA